MLLPLSSPSVPVLALVLLMTYIHPPTAALWCNYRPSFCLEWSAGSHLKSTISTEKYSIVWGLADN